MRDLLNLEKKKIDTEVEKRKAKRKLVEMDLKVRETENQNLRERIMKEKSDFESEFVER